MVVSTTNEKSFLSERREEQLGDAKKWQYILFGRIILPSWFIKEYIFPVLTNSSLRGVTGSIFVIHSAHVNPFLYAETPRTPLLSDQDR